MSRIDSVSVCTHGVDKASRICTMCIAGHAQQRHPNGSVDLQGTHNAYVRGLEFRVLEQRERAEQAEADVRALGEELRNTKAERDELKKRLDDAQRTIQGFTRTGAAT